MANLFNYPSKAAYLADTSRPAQQSAVSYDGSETIVDGKNVIVPFTPENCGIGDMVVFDTIDGILKILKWETYYQGTFDSARYIMSKGVFVGMHGKKALFFAIENAASASVKWAAACYFRLTGLDLSQDGSFTFKTYYASAAHVDNVVSWEAGATLDSIVATIAALGLSASYFKAAKLADGTGIGIQVDYPTTANVSNIFSLTAQSGGAAEAEVEYMNQFGGNDVVFQYVLTNTLIPARIGAATIVRRCGFAGSSAGGNFPEYYDYYKTNGSATFVSDSEVGVMTQATFEGLAASSVPEQVAFYNKYGGDYAKYIEARMMLEDTQRGVAGLAFEDGVEQTALLAAVMTKDYNNADIPAFPAAYYAALYGVNAATATGFEAGKWGLPSPLQIKRIINQVGLNASNKTTLNKAIDKFKPTGNFYGNGSYFWTFAEYSAYGAFVYYGSYGTVYGTVKHNTCSSRGLLALAFD